MYCSREKIYVPIEVLIQEENRRLEERKREEIFEYAYIYDDVRDDWEEEKEDLEISIDLGD